MFRLVPGDSRSSKTNNFLYSDIFECAWTCIIIYSHFIVFIFWCIHIQQKSLKPYRIHAYLNIFKIKFFVSYFWPALDAKDLTRRQRRQRRNCIFTDQCGVMYGSSQAWRVKYSVPLETAAKNWHRVRAAAVIYSSLYVPCKGQVSRRPQGADCRRLR
jgi:hypothetical protein